MLTVLDARATPTEQIQARLQQGAPQPTPEMEAQVRAICERVRTDGDRALLEFTRQWDCPTLETLEVSEAEFEAAYRQLGEATLTAIRHAVARVRRFHKQMRPHSWHLLEAHGGWLGQLVRPLERVGVYAPGGRARYPSTVIMNAVPARVAGVDEIILCTPPQHDGSIPASVLVAAREAGVQRVFKVGGAQADCRDGLRHRDRPRRREDCGTRQPVCRAGEAAAVGHRWRGHVGGTERGRHHRRWKREPRLHRRRHADPNWSMARSRSATCSQPSEQVLQGTLAALEAQLPQRARRAILRESLARSLAVLTRSLPEAFELANLAAPEHLTLMVQHPMHWLSHVRNAGCILLGSDTPQSAGDYLAGPSHTLPTGRAARFESPVSVETFLKRSSIIALSRDALRPPRTRHPRPRR
jgi:histidinol dehydrogenase